MLYSFFNTLIKGYLKYRYTRIQAMYSQSPDLQAQLWAKQWPELYKTSYRPQFTKLGTLSIQDYKQAFPIIQYEDIADHILMMMDGKESVLWPGKISWYAKSSGTTNDKSKYIPITDTNLFDNHVTSSWDAMAIVYAHTPDSRIFDKKNILMGGSLVPNTGSIYVGDISAVLLNRMPAVGRPFYSPDFETALMQDWERKIELMAEICSKDDIAMLAGVPTWTLVLLRRILEVSGKENMLEVWPHVRTYLHGGVGFDPYIEQFKKYFPSDDFNYYEVYNASEGYFAVQDQKGVKGMLLLTDNGIYYEFIPLEKSGEAHPDTLTLNEVEVGKDYVIVISNSSGLWRYKPGDVVRFTSVAPFRIEVSGRTKHYINVFGEEVMVHNTDYAIKETSAACGGSIIDYTVGPIFMEENKGGHHWLIEFDQLPENISLFSDTLDQKLRSINSDYDAKRYKDLALAPLKLDVMPKGTFKKWLVNKGKLGGQSKIPRLSNDRNYITELLNL